jgi:hypothetical protein
LSRSVDGVSALATDADDVVASGPSDFAETQTDVDRERAEVEMVVTYAAIREQSLALVEQRAARGRIFADQREHGAGPRSAVGRAHVACEVGGASCQVESLVAPVQVSKRQCFQRQRFGLETSGADFVCELRAAHAGGERIGVLAARDLHVAAQAQTQQLGTGVTDFACAGGGLTGDFERDLVMTHVARRDREHRQIREPQTCQAALFAQRDAVGKELLRRPHVAALILRIAEPPQRAREVVG